MQKIVPFLWFNDKAEEAMNLYGSIFKDFEIIDVVRNGKHGMGPEGSVFSVTFKLFEQQYIGLNGGPMFTFSSAISFFVNCDNQEEVDEYWEKLSEGGEKIQCGWLKDKFGLSWQIVPTALGRLMHSGDPEKSSRVAKAMMKMVKLDIALLQKAFDGEE